MNTLRKWMLAGAVMWLAIQTAGAAETPAEDAADAMGLYTVFHQDGRFYAFGDHKVYREFLGGHEPAYVLTRIGAGPQKQTLTFGMTKADSAKKSDELGYVRLYDGAVEPAAGFYGEAVREGRYFVFDDWRDMQAFVTSGEAPYIVTLIGKGPGGATLTVVRNKATVQDTAAADALIARFRQLHGL